MAVAAMAVVAAMDAPGGGGGHTHLGSVDSNNEVQRSIPSVDELEVAVLHERTLRCGARVAIAMWIRKFVSDQTRSKDKKNTVWVLWSREWMCITVVGQGMNSKRETCSALKKHMLGWCPHGSSATRLATAHTCFSFRARHLRIISDSSAHLSVTFCDDASSTERV